MGVLVNAVSGLQGVGNKTDPPRLGQSSYESISCKWFADRVGYIGRGSKMCSKIVESRDASEGGA